MDYGVSLKARPSLSVQHLQVTGDFSVLKVQELCQIFPNVTSLYISPVLDHKPAIPYGDIWACWPDLESLSIYEGAEVFRKNLDSEFLGIYPEEVELLRQLGDEALENSSGSSTVLAVLNHPPEPGWRVK